MKRIVFWLITILVILGAWLTFPRAENNIPREYATLTPPANFADADSIAAGREIFLTNCAPCHGIAGNGRGTLKPAFGPPPADFTDRTRAQRYTPQYLFWRISEGGQVEPFRAQGSVMPAWKFRLSEAERWQVAAYIATFAR